MTYIKHFMYKCTTRLLSLMVTLNTVGMPGNCEAFAQSVPPPPPFNNYNALITVVATTAAAAATTTYKWLQKKEAENVVKANSVIEANPYNVKEISNGGVVLSPSPIGVTKPLTSEGEKAKSVVGTKPVVEDNTYNVKEITTAGVVPSPSPIGVTKPLTNDGSNTKPGTSSSSNDIKPEIASGGNNTPSGSISMEGNSSAGNTSEPENMNLATVSPVGTQNFLQGVLDFHNYTTSQLHQSFKNRLSREAVAAGDASQKLEKGLWAQGILGSAVERKSASSSGYNGRFHGFTIGADAEFNDDLLVGVAFSNVISKLKFKDQYNGDKTSINTQAASLYGRKDITNKVYVSTTASLTKSSTNASYLATNAQGQQSYKYQEQKNIKGGFIEAKLHYVNTLSNSMVLTPFVGVSYSKSALPGFSGIDSTGLPLAIASLKSEYTNMMIGTSLSLPSYSTNKLAIMPKINASVDQRIHSKIGSVQVTDSNGNPVTVKSSDKNKTTLNLGGSMDIAYKSTDFLIAYDTQIKSKFLGQQVALKVRVNL